MKNTIGFIVLLAAVLGCSSFSKKETANTAAPPSSKIEPAKSDAPASASDITIDKYKQITVGMKIEDAIKILGPGGTEGKSSGSGSTKFSSYDWKGPNNSTMTLALIGDAVSSKSQNNLQTTKDVPKADLSIAKYEQVQTGMTYDEAAKIIGSEGAQTNDSYSDTFKTSTYKWEGNGRMSISLKDGKISSKSQGNLK